ncbi:(4Fe-4S)-binding protein [Membranihabitans marinus]|uniref:(4Fe-4S)-binding protein n=1 Tax=Membranihabitans marinus TaxID=1227546 RepID=UPI001F227D71|nr:(4Fe-4S)-binding protein [Membranihabitans marinus]
MKKEYKKDDLTVTWDAKKCIHSEKCWRGLNAVFQPRSRPWIVVDNASAEAITRQIDQCPSGALGYYYGQEEESKKVTEAEEIVIEVISNGPYKLVGQLSITKPNGEIEKKDRAFLCRCGHSENKPYCDGSHKGIGFIG